MNELDLFTSALALSDLSERSAYLDRACAGNLDLRRRLDELLTAYARGGSPLDSHSGGTGENADLPPADATATFAADPAIPTADYPGKDEHAGAVIAGKYTLVEAIGEGGMGAVWRAKQTEPVKRYVAIKLIKAGMDSKQVLARFEAERQALALMDHPNIAKVLDGGLHEGRPYFVMELVKGVPITDYCDARKLTPKERLELFVPVCQAIQHAHQKGIIHRDIKPSNVLIALYDDKPVVKVIDFGVAKATGGTLTERTIDTGFGGVVGTPQYMSPEQATFNNLDIDTRSDVYALGVLLYELLTGSPPFTHKDLEKRGLLEMLRVVREEEPPRPSTKLSTADALPTLSANRGTEPKKLTGLLRNELDWIVMKALEKDRTRRYETANSFAADVLLFLGGEAVQAHPPSTGYRLRKAYRRNRTAVHIGVAFAVLLVTGAGVSVWQVVEARRAEVKARLAEAETRIVLNFFNDKLLSAARPEGDSIGGVGLGYDISLRAAIDAAEPEISPALGGHPEAEAEIRYSLAVTYSWFGEPAQASRQLERVLALRGEKFGANHYLTIWSMSLLAEQLYESGGRHREAVALAEEALVLAKTHYGPDDTLTLLVMRDLGNIYREERRYPEAIALLEDLVDRRRTHSGPEYFQTMMAMSRLGMAYEDAGRRADAVPLLEASLNGLKVQLGPNHPYTFGAMKNLAWSYERTGRLAEAIVLLSESLKLCEIVRGPDHPVTARWRMHTIETLESAGRWSEAAALCAKEVQRRLHKLRNDHRALARDLCTIGYCQLRAGNPVAAEVALGECLQIEERRFPDEWRHFSATGSLGESLLRQKKYADAEPLLLKGYEGMKQREKTIPPQGAIRLPEAIDRLIELYTTTNKPDEVKKWKAERAKYPSPQVVAPMPREKK